MNVLADLVALAHAAFVVFIWLGMILILAGIILRWHSTRHVGFRVAHLAAILFVVARVWLGVPCPLSVCEDSLRKQAHPPENATGWRQVFHRCALRNADPDRFAIATTAFGAVALAAFVFGGHQNRKTSIIRLARGREFL